MLVTCSDPGCTECDFAERSFIIGPRKLVKAEYVISNDKVG